MTVDPVVRLLIIDDDAGTRRTITAAAEPLGFEVRGTDNASVFNEYLKSWQPGLVIVDLQMPGRDGIQVLHDLGTAKCEAQIIVASGAGSRILEAAARIGRQHNLKIAGTLAKPFPLEVIRALLGQFRPLADLSSRELAVAIETEQLFLEYQPKFGGRCGQITGVEALVRWLHPQRGRQAPDQFIKLAEASGLIEPLTDWVFRTAVRQAKAWHDLGLTLDVAVNISACSLASPDLPERLEACCDELAFDRNSLVLEITESSAMQDPLHAMELLTRLRLKGFKLSIDDFGTGYSSLIQLHKMPFSELKIDCSFVINMMQDDDCRVIVRTLIDLARNLGLRSVAEGVENEDIWKELQAMGCDSAQGYYLSRPLAAEDIASLIESSIAIHPSIKQPPPL